MTLYDISLEINEDMISWDDKEDLKPKIDEGTRSESSGSIKSQICLDSHTGTHVDAPKHFLRDGKSIDKVQITKLRGECRVVDCTDRKQEVKAEDVPDCEERIVLFKTKNSELLSQNKFATDYVYVSENACEKVSEYGYEAVGIDYLGIGKYGNTRPSHEALLGNEIIVIEGLDLRDISPGSYYFTGLPLKIEGCDGSPVRAVLED